MSLAVQGEMYPIRCNSCSSLSIHFRVTLPILDDRADGLDIWPLAASPLGISHAQDGHRHGGAGTAPTGPGEGRRAPDGGASSSKGRNRPALERMAGES